MTEKGCYERKGVRDVMRERERMVEERKEKEKKEEGGVRDVMIDRG